jgi:putative membrane protein
LAQQNASSSAVKQFGQRIVDDHTQANDELTQIASQKNITLPTSLSARDQATMDRLSKLNGAEFDHAYMQYMVADHRKDVGAFKRESERGTDPDLKAFASKTLPVVEEHLSIAEKTAGEMRPEAR